MCHSFTPNEETRVGRYLENKLFDVCCQLNKKLGGGGGGGQYHQQQIKAYKQTNKQTKTKLSQIGCAIYSCCIHKQNRRQPLLCSSFHPEHDISWESQLILIINVWATRQTENVTSPCCHPNPIHQSVLCCDLSRDRKIVVS